MIEQFNEKYNDGTKLQGKQYLVCPKQVGCFILLQNNLNTIGISDYRFMLFTVGSFLLFLFFSLGPQKSHPCYSAML